MGKVSEEWYDARLDVFDEFWNNKIDFDTFKSEIEKIDRSFRRRM